MARVTIEMIETKEFSREPHGYNSKEVDAFLDDICDEMEALQNEIQKLQQQNSRVVEAPAARAAVQDPAADSFREILEMARKVKEETIQKANEDAEAIRARAQSEADARMAGLEKEKESLTQEVAQLKKTATEYRDSFVALLQAQQDALDKASDLF